MKIIEGICDYYFDLFKICLNKSFESDFISVEYDDETVVKHKIYGAEWSLPLNNFIINAAYVDLKTDDNDSQILLLENEGNYVVLSKIDGEYSIFNKLKGKILLQDSAHLVSSFEKMINVGFSWKPNKVSKDIIEFLNSLI